MEKSRKKQRTMAIVAIVLMVCLVLALGTFTFAKYITSSTSGNQSATAAKWNFTITVNAENLFPSNYKLEDGETLATKVDGDGVAVKASKATLAPGTTGSMTITISGSSETMAKLTFGLDATDSKYSEIHVGTGDDAYYPVVWTLKQGEETALETGTLSKIAEYLNDDSQSAATIEAGSTTTTKTYTLSWVWEYDGENSDAEKDTAIGETAANVYSGDLTDIVATMSFELVVSVEQAQQK